jgi:putative sporulation protein YtaF
MLVFSILLSAAVSADAFLIGAAYGIKNVQIPFFSKLITGFCACASGFFAIWAKKSASCIFPANITETINICALCVLFVYFFAKAVFTNIRPGEKISVVDFAVKSMGLKIMVVRDMSECDIDGSGIIDKKEALLLGLALSGDIAAVGLFAFPHQAQAALFAVLTGVFCILCLSAGNKIGKTTTLAGKNFKKIADFSLPAVIFISLMTKLFL